MMSMRVSEEERTEILSSIRREVSDYPIIPVFKEEESLLESLRKGNVDLIINTVDYGGDATQGRGLVRPIKPWCQATAGYSIGALSVGNILGVINRITKEEKNRHKFIYFRVRAPDMPLPRISYVDEAMEEIREIERDLLVGNVLREEWYDR